MFKKVLNLNEQYLIEADNEWKVVQKIQRAAPVSIIGKKIALIEEISRADVAALFIQELLLEKLYGKRTPRNIKTESATDIQGHVFQTDIETVMGLGVKGLEPSPDHKFYPNEKVTRAAYAMMIEDILIKVSGDKGLATKFLGSKSPFPDLRNNLPYFNAVMVVTSRGIMQAKDLTTGDFAPMGTVSGADALLIIRNLKDELRSFVLVSPSLKVKCPKCGAVFAKDDPYFAVQGRAGFVKCPKCGAVFLKEDYVVK